MSSSRRMLGTILAACMIVTTGKRSAQDTPAPDH